MQRNVGYLLLVMMLALISVGVIMLLSTSGRLALDVHADLYAPLRKQMIWLVLGSIVCIVVSRIDYRWITRHSWIWVGGSAFLMMLCLAPYIGKKAKGASRWIDIGGFTLQPSELAKVAFVCFLAWWLGQNQRRIREFGRGVAVPVAVFGVFAIILAKFQNDLGYTSLMGGILFVMLLCAGVSWYYLAPIPILGVTGILGLAWMMPERQGRLLAFLDIEKYKQGDGWQVYQALVALGSGGTEGLGLGNSRQKMFWLPEAHTDFVFPILGEELGVWVALGVVFCFLIMTLTSGWIAVHAPDATGVLLGIGITALFAIQTLMNLCVVTSLMPNKGVPLPFISYGGSSLMMWMVCVGLLFNLQRQGIYESDHPAPQPLKRATVRL